MVRNVEGKTSILGKVNIENILWSGIPCIDEQIPIKSGDFGVKTRRALERTRGSLYFS